MTKESKRPGNARLLLDSAVTKNMLGDMMFKYVKDDTRRRIEQCGATDESNAEDFEFVGDDDVIVC